MKNLSFLLITLFIYGCAFAQNTEETAIEYQEGLTKQYKDPEESPLKDKAHLFEGHDFFPIDSTYRVEAKFIRTLNALPFQMKTTGNRLPVYEKYGEVHFEIDGRKLVLTLFQNHQLRETEEYRDYLSLPFTDLTNDHETYGGGRFLDMRIPTGDTIIIDFNKAYNPYCAYTEGYSCVIPPKENSLDVQILAGVKKPKKE